MLGSERVLFALALAATAAMGCGGGENNQTTGTGGEGGSPTTSSTGGSGGTGGGGSGGGEPLMCDSGEGTVLAVSELTFGEGDSGWKKVGFNIDGLVSTASSKDLCKPSSGASNSTPYPDGEEGIDNSFGKNLLPVILSLYPTWVEDINDGIQSGVFTTLVKMECLPPTGDVPVLTTKLFGGTELDYTPKFDGTDTWPVTPELLSDPKDPLSSTVVFPKSSVKGSEFDSGKGQTFILTVPLKTQNGDSTSIKLTLYSAHVTMTLADDRKSATDGRIGGVVDTEELVTEIKKVGYLLNLCDTTVFNDIVTMVRQASDIMVDGTQDPTQTCNAISVGLTFKMTEAQIGDVGPATPVGMGCQ